MPTRKPDRSFGRNFRSTKSSFNPRRTKTIDASSIRASEATSHDEKIEATRLAHALDESMGFARYDSGKKKVGWLCNMHSTSVEDEKVPGGRAGVDFYFLEEDGGSFKATVEYDPYFLIAVKRGREAEVEEWCRRKFEGAIKGIKRTEKEDLQMPNHLLGYRRPFLQLTFANVGDLLGARKAIMPTAEKNKKNMNAMDTYAEVARWIKLRSLFLDDSDFFSVLMPDLTFTMMNKMTIDDLIRLQMRATLLLIFENTMFLTMCGWQLIKVRVTAQGRWINYLLSQISGSESGTRWRRSTVSLILRASKNDYSEPIQ